MSTNTITGIVSISSGTSAVWNSTTKIIPQGVYMYETDTGKAKIADGSSLYSALPYHVGPISLLGIGNGLAASGGNLVVQNSDTTIAVASGGIKVNPTALSYPMVDHSTVSSGTVTFDRSAGADHRLSVGGSLSVAFANWPAAGNFSSMVIELVNGGSATITWPTMNWIKSDGSGAYSSTFSGSGITLQTSGTDWITLWSRDGGATIVARVAH